MSTSSAPSLTRLVEGDPTLQIERDRDSGEMILSGLSESHVQLSAGRLASKFHVEVDIKDRRVPYRETVTARGQASTCTRSKPAAADSTPASPCAWNRSRAERDLSSATRFVGGAVPRNYIPAVEKGVVESLPRGRLPLTDLRVTLYDGKHHDVDSSEMAFKLAASQALKESVSSARPILLEPIHSLRINRPRILDRRHHQRSQFPTRSRAGHGAGRRAARLNRRGRRGPNGRVPPLRDRPPLHDRRPRHLRLAVRALRSGPRARRPKGPPGSRSGRCRLKNRDRQEAHRHGLRSDQALGGTSLRGTDDQLRVRPGTSNPPATWTPTLNRRDYSSDSGSGRSSKTIRTRSVTVSEPAATGVGAKSASSAAKARASATGVRARSADRGQFNDPRNLVAHVIGDRVGSRLRIVDRVQQR